MKYLKKLFPLILVLSLSVFGNSLDENTISLDNITPADIFYTNTWSAAWEPYGKVKYFGNWIAFEKDYVVLARLEVFNYFFMPHPFNCIYDDDMKEVEIIIEDLNVENHNLKFENKNLKKSRNKSFGWGAVVGAVLTSIIIISIKK